MSKFTRTDRGDRCGAEFGQLFFRAPSRRWRWRLRPTLRRKARLRYRPKPVGQAIEKAKSVQLVTFPETGWSPVKVVRGGASARGDNAKPSSAEKAETAEIITFGDSNGRSVRILRGDADPSAFRRPRRPADLLRTQIVTFADPRARPVSVLRGWVPEPADIELFGPASIADLDRVAFAVDGAEFEPWHRSQNVAAGAERPARADAGHSGRRNRCRRRGPVRPRAEPHSGTGLSGAHVSALRQLARRRCRVQLGSRQCRCLDRRRPAGTEISPRGRALPRPCYARGGAWKPRFRGLQRRLAVSRPSCHVGWRGRRTIDGAAVQDVVIATFCSQAPVVAPGSDLCYEPRRLAGRNSRCGGSVPRFEIDKGRAAADQRRAALRTAFHWLPRRQAFLAWLSVTRRRCSILPMSAGRLKRSPPTCGNCATMLQAERRFRAVDPQPDPVARAARGGDRCGRRARRAVAAGS